MKTTRISVLLLVALSLSAALMAQTDTQWTLVQSTLTYHMSHPMHEVDGTATPPRERESAMQAFAIS